MGLCWSDSFCLRRGAHVVLPGLRVPQAELHTLSILSWLAVLLADVNLDENEFPEELILTSYSGQLNAPTVQDRNRLPNGGHEEPSSAFYLFYSKSGAPAPPCGASLSTERLDVTPGLALPQGS